MKAGDYMLASTFPFFFVFHQSAHYIIVCSSSSLWLWLIPVYWLLSWLFGVWFHASWMVSYFYLLEQYDMVHIPCDELLLCMYAEWFTPWYSIVGKLFMVLFPDPTYICQHDEVWSTRCKGFDTWLELFKCWPHGSPVLKSGIGTSE